jgi:hypothetical protein
MTFVGYPADPVSFIRQIMIKMPYAHNCTISAAISGHRQHQRGMNGAHLDPAVREDGFNVLHKMLSKENLVLAQLMASILQVCERLTLAIDNHFACSRRSIMRP